MATKTAKVLFMVAGLLFVIAALVPALAGKEVNTASLSMAVVFLVVAVALRPRRPPPPPSGPGA